MEKVRIHIRMDAELKSILKKKADESQTPVNKYIVNILKESVNNDISDSVHIKKTHTIVSNISRRVDSIAKEFNLPIDD